MMLAGLGGLLGLLVAIPSTRALSHFLVGIGPGDPRTMAGASASILLVALAACWIPARRASRVAPNAALKAD